MWARVQQKRNRGSVVVQFPMAKLVQHCNCQQQHNMRLELLRFLLCDLHGGVAEIQYPSCILGERNHGQTRNGSKQDSFWKVLEHATKEVLLHEKQFLFRCRIKELGVPRLTLAVMWHEVLNDSLVQQEAQRNKKGRKDHRHQFLVEIQFGTLPENILELGKQNLQFHREICSTGQLLMFQL
eukprot:TRINITY_DN1187_c0_g2_i4.p2 TRINITY_DN1187_c0_g2~~TRINITY_DN1187_c0_g2_i4.p2  ORF type:complete len:182 (+),score=22.42 TRINITY_DN1187_c0_g2_i4:572-1117(+)